MPFDARDAKWICCELSIYPYGFEPGEVNCVTVSVEYGWKHKYHDVVVARRTVPAIQVVFIEEEWVLLSSDKWHVS